VRKYRRERKQKNPSGRGEEWPKHQDAMT
jgi:hypothetical protein